MPNLPVDVDSWGRSACYPQGNFYPFSDGPSTQNHRITKPDFRPCSRCPSRSQAPFCLCTPRTISNRAEGTFGRLRYPLGGDRPSQTAHLTLSLPRLTGPRLERRSSKGGIPTSAPPELAPRLPCLPPILYIDDQHPMSGYSKAPWGLSVQSQVACVFTGTSISPGPSLRQRPSRYAIRAGRNLPDKEFRYLRTVIVTAAVHWGFGSELPPLIRDSPFPLTFQHWAGVSHYTSGSPFAVTCVFGKQSLGPLHCGQPTLRTQGASHGSAPLLPKLRGHFAEFLNEGFPARLRIFSSPTCGGFRYGHPLASLRGFSRQSGPGQFATQRSLPITPRGPVQADFPAQTPYRLGRALPVARWSFPPASPLRSKRLRGGIGISTDSPSPTLSASA